MKSIKTKLMVFVGSLIAVICVGLVVLSFVSASSALKKNLADTLPEIAEQTANNIDGRLDGELKSLESIAAREDISNPELSLESKLKILKEESERLGAVRMGIVDTKGNLTNTDGTTAEIQDREYYQKALNGESNVADPVQVEGENIVVVPYLVPIQYGDKIVGVLLETRDGNDLSTLTNEVKVGKNGLAFMLNKDGKAVANSDQEKVTDGYNLIEESKSDESLQSLAVIEKKMILGETGMGEFSYQGTDKFIGYAPVGDTGWSVGITVTQKDMLSELDGLKSTSILISVVFILLGLADVYFIAGAITKGIKLTSKHLKFLAEGNLSETIQPKYLKSKDEVGEMTNAMKNMQGSLRNMIQKIKDNSTDINTQSDQLSLVAEEISSTAQGVTQAITEVAQGTNDQSESLIAVTGILDEFNNKLDGMVGEIQSVDSNSREISVMANDSSAEMNRLNESVTDVSHSFKEFYEKITALGQDVSQISHITKLINDIAEQTNLLALNAAIEAARAGEAGKGFSVVADEIRILAEKSKESASHIGDIVNEIAKRTESMVTNSTVMDSQLMEQVQVIENTLVSFQKIIAAIDEIIPEIKRIKGSAETIERDKNDVRSKIEEISTISLEVSASSEEISASSQEMSASTEEVAASAQVLSSATGKMLKEVEKFVI